jgi:hypothetical protein
MCGGLAPGAVFSSHDPEGQCGGMCLVAMTLRYVGVLAVTWWVYV